jgi:hypothetical protein
MKVLDPVSVAQALAKAFVRQCQKAIDDVER